MRVLQLYSALTNDEQRLIFEDFGTTRKVILSTNIAETAITINGIVYVVDCGFVKIRHYNAKKGVENLVVLPVSLSSAKQRAGRAGRNQLGKCYRLYTKNTMDELDEFNIPEILRCNLDEIVLFLSEYCPYNIQSFPFLDAPESSHIAKSLEMLKTMGALDPSGTITELGRDIIDFPLEPSYAYCLLNSMELSHQSMLDVITIVAITSGENLYTVNKSLTANNNPRNKFKNSSSDHLSKLHLFYAYIETKNKKKFCEHFGVRKRALDNIILVREQLVNIVKAKKAAKEQLSQSNSLIPKDKHKVYTNKLNMNDANKNEIISKIDVHFTFDKPAIISCLRKSFFNKIAELDSDGFYRIKDTYEKAKLHPESVLFMARSRPKKVVFNTLITTTKTYINDVSEIQ